MMILSAASAAAAGPVVALQKFGPVIALQKIKGKTK
jgi:hypothetical protein